MLNRSLLLELICVLRYCLLTVYIDWNVRDGFVTTNKDGQRQPICCGLPDKIETKEEFIGLLTKVRFGKHSRERKSEF